MIFGNMKLACQCHGSNLAVKGNLPLKANYDWYRTFNLRHLQGY